MPSVSKIFCHPLKGVGRLSLDGVDLAVGKTMPFDRVWAVSHEASKFDAAAPKWTPCGSFIRGASSPELQAIQVVDLSADGDIALQYRNNEPFVFNPDDPDDHAGFLAWVGQYVPDNRAQPRSIVQAPDRGMTDSSMASISILNLASLQALSDKAGVVMEPERFRGNLWLEGFDAWAENDWLDKTIKIGEAEILFRNPIGRCMATTVDTQTGKQNVPTLDILEKNWAHTNFGVYGEVVKAGAVNIADKAQIL